MHLNTFPHCQHGLRKLTVKERNIFSNCSVSRWQPGWILGEYQKETQVYSLAWAAVFLFMAARQGYIYSSTLESLGLFLFLSSADGQLQLSV